MIAAWMWWTAPALAQGARTYELDPGPSVLYVLVLPDPGTPLSAFGHDHTVAATGWSGTVTWDPADPSACQVQVRVPVAGLVIDPPGFRARAGLEGETPEDVKPKVLENIWGPRQLELDRFPSVEFRSRACEADGATTWITGDFTLHGVTRPVRVGMKLTTDAGGLRAQGTFSILGSDFGFQPYTAGLGMIRNQDRLAFTLDVRGR